MDGDGGVGLALTGSPTTNQVARLMTRTAPMRIVSGASGLLGQ